jgi:hypothetical protein
MRTAFLRARCNAARAMSPLMPLVPCTALKKPAAIFSSIRGTTVMMLGFMVLRPSATCFGSSTQ